MAGAKLSCTGEWLINCGWKILFYDGCIVSLLVGYTKALVSGEKVAIKSKERMDENFKIGV